MQQSASEIFILTGTNGPGSLHAALMSRTDAFFLTLVSLCPCRERVQCRRGEEGSQRGGLGDDDNADVYHRLKTQERFRIFYSNPSLEYLPPLQIYRYKYYKYKYFSHLCNIRTDVDKNPLILPHHVFILPLFTLLLNEISVCSPPSHFYI